ncbi:endonuclease domain-containing protein [Microbacterium sp. SORGH_AS_0888]|uniref:endonuclease domain-containing protein n=1 Tax=Microbacterium sp. SORGH_AS_0888 TaxID=3041791 RepID=UPI00278106DF|nr:DUF559 domain-containing protein [Microbacterium sp. SORGH_AS_0888]MDQ1128195.1 very-short-patch-repair endonuclease [Microbacterium sp. SORGH_AS_0888]
MDDRILNVLFQTAGCLGRREALPIWESAAAGGHVDPAELVRVARRSREASALAAAASALSGSGIETVFVMGMSAEGVDVRQQVRVDGHPLDGLIGDRLGIQLDGFAHHRAAQRRGDLRADARLVLRGFTLLRFDYHQVMFDGDHVRATVLMAMAQGLHRAR